MREAGLGRVSWRRNTHNTQEVCNNSTGVGRGDDNHVQQHITASIILTMTRAISKTLTQKQYGRGNAHLSVGGPGGQGLDHV